MLNAQLIPVPFYDDTLLLGGRGNEPFVAMKPVVENMGLAWQAQRRKLVETFASVITIMVSTGSDGKQYSMTCLPLRKFPAWLYSISPNKVNPALRDKIVRYQSECDDVLWDYWTKGVENRPSALPIHQVISLQHNRLELLDKLESCTHPIKRQAIHEQLALTSQLLGLTTPNIDSLGHNAPPEPPLVSEFWECVKQLDSAGAAWNHARDRRSIAINLPNLERLAKQHQLDLAPVAAIRHVLKNSKEPQFVAYRTVNSAILRAAIKCYVFEATKPAEIA